MPKRLVKSPIWKAALIEMAASGEFDVCIEWPFSKSHNGYGQCQWNGKIQRVNRIVCEMAHGPAPEGKPNALHTCGNPGCINGKHLYWGDHFDNFADRDADGTTCRAEDHPCALLTNDEVCQIRSVIGEISITELGRIYGVRPRVISNAARGKTYASVECGDE